MQLLYFLTGNTLEAEPLYKKSLNSYIKTVGEKYPDVAHVYYNLANLYFVKKEYQKSYEFMDKSAFIFKMILPKTHLTLIQVEKDLKIIRKEMSKFSFSKVLKNIFSNFLFIFKR